MWNNCRCLQVIYKSYIFSLSNSCVMLQQLSLNQFNQFFLCRNLCLSLRPGCTKKNLMLLWQHECTWVYSHRMVSEVDVRRYRQAFVTAVKKEFTNDEEVYLTKSKNGHSLLRLKTTCIKIYCNKIWLIYDTVFGSF